VPTEKQSIETVMKDVIEFRQGFQTLYYNFDHAQPKNLEGFQRWSSVA
jgi:hypothetical protein